MQSIKLTTVLKEKKHWLAFWLAFLMACVVFIPFMIFDKGYFFFFGDFNVQQIPFYQLAHESVRSGNILWNWKTDLGANFLGSYSFYLIFSPFFWLTLPFPTSFVPHLMGPLLILKTACAALTSYWFLQRFVKNKDYAVIGSILYAFSGFAVYNVFFNHFHEVLIFFPLLLIALEELVEHNRRGWFAAAVALNCLVNYWFFIGEVVFVLLYVLVRMLSPGWQMTPKKFLSIALESVLGLGLSMFLLLPSLLAIAGNPRTTADNLLTGWNFWIYWDDQRLPAILQSIFFPPDLPSRPNFFPDHGAKWASLSAWLPLFSTVGVISFLSWAKRSWIKRLLLLCLALALTPGTNSLFVLFNHSYYARWFYMPILLMCLATIIALEQRETDFMRGIRWTGLIIVIFTVACGLTPNKVDGEWKLGMVFEPARFWLAVSLAVLCLMLTLWLVRRYKPTLQSPGGEPQFTRAVLCTLSAVSVLHAGIFIANGKMHSDNTEWIRDVALAGREELALPEEPFARSDLYKSMDNLGMYWGLPNIQAFHSIIPNSIMEFYPEVGVKRDVSSKPDVRLFALRDLLSVRWFIVPDKYDDGVNLMPNYTFYSNQLGYSIFENDNWLPMGFGYDTTFDTILFNQLPIDTRSRMMIQAVYLEEEAIARNSDILTLLSEPPYETMDMLDDTEDVEARRELACDSFDIDNLGFTATCDLPKETLMFFSVPYDAGWTATVNGEPVVVEKANIGFMAVRVPAGPAEIRFNYLTPGLLPGLVVTGGSAVLLALYVLLRRGKSGESPHTPVVEGTEIAKPTQEQTLENLGTLLVPREEELPGSADTPPVDEEGGQPNG